MYSTYNIKAEELSLNFLDAIRKMFAGQQLEITVSAMPDETNYLLSVPANRKRLLKSVENIKKGKKLIELDMDHLKSLADEKSTL